MNAEESKFSQFSIFPWYYHGNGMEKPENGMVTPLLPGGNAIFTMVMVWIFQWNFRQVVWKLHFYQVVMPVLPW